MLRPDRYPLAQIYASSQPGKVDHDQPTRSQRAGGSQPAQRRPSRGPTTDEGKQRSAQNALKHGMRAQRFVLLDDEAALHEQLAPEGALQNILFARVALAVWRMFRTDRMEVELLNPHLDLDARECPGGLGLALIRDGHGPRAFDTLSRYRGAVQAEFWRALRGLYALKAGDALPVAPVLGAAPAMMAPGSRASGPTLVAGERRQREPVHKLSAAAGRNPNEPESRSQPDGTASRAPRSSAGEGLAQRKRAMRSCA